MSFQQHDEATDGGKKEMNRMRERWNNGWNGACTNNREIDDRF